MIRLQLLISDAYNVYFKIKTNNEYYVLHF